MSDLSAVLPRMHAWLSANAPAVPFGLFTTRFPNFRKKHLQSHFSFVDRAGIFYISSEGTAGNDAGGAAVLTSLSGSETAVQRELQTWDKRFSVGGLVHVDLDGDVRLAKVIECRGVSMDLFVLADEVPVPDIPLCAIRQLPEQLAADASAGSWEGCSVWRKFPLWRLCRSSLARARNLRATKFSRCCCGCKIAFVMVKFSDGGQDSKVAVADVRARGVPFVGEVFEESPGAPQRGPQTRSLFSRKDEQPEAVEDPGSTRFPGVVVSVNEEKGVCTIASRFGSIFCPRSAVIADGALRVGREAKFEISWGRQLRLQANDVVLGPLKKIESAQWRAQRARGAGAILRARAEVPENKEIDKNNAATLERMKAAHVAKRARADG
ncbi:unnamed protein product [Prorocentrum cordatum]|uniref:Uncharacterized protein n=1 Tax=Prorocentrum cordatum TaxID=2364126 RepID=A0ABN9Q2X9_9DINO|nr:unnamed protein product [Polarella glacialis]